jgi:hypothetical protein
MRTKRCWISLSAVVFCVWLLSAIVSGISPSEQSQLEHFGISTLRGLKAVRAQVMLAKDENEKFSGLTQEKLQEQLEDALRKGGIKILSSPERRDDDRFVVLVQLAKAGTNIPFCAMHVQTGLFQTVELTRDPIIRTHAQTWPAFGKSSFGVIRLAAVDRIIRETMARQVDEFINDYLAANQKEEQMITGTVRYLNLEGGFYGLVADDGERYDPINLPQEYAKDGLRVRFKVKEKKGMSGIHMWGKIVEIITIEKL